MHRLLLPAGAGLCLWLAGCASSCSSAEPAEPSPSPWLGGPRSQPQPLWRPAQNERLPDGFPLAIPADAQVQAGATVGNGSERTWMATVLGTAGLPASVAFYETELKGRGLSVQRHELVVEGRQMVTLAASATGREATVALSEAEEGVFAQISVREKGPFAAKPDPTPAPR